MDSVQRYEGVIRYHDSLAGSKVVQFDLYPEGYVEFELLTPATESTCASRLKGMANRIAGRQYRSAMISLTAFDGGPLADGLKETAKLLFELFEQTQYELEVIGSWVCEDKSVYSFSDTLRLVTEQK